MKKLILFTLFTCFLILPSFGESVKNMKYIGSLNDISVFVGDCGTINAYSVEGRFIVLCNELRPYVNIYSTTFILYHEVAHILHKDLERDITCAKRYGGDTTGYCSMRMKSHEIDADSYAINRLIDEGYDERVCGFLERMKADEVGDESHPPTKGRYLRCRDHMKSGEKVYIPSNLGDD